ncbi:hypothetical protein [Secundilactobacillus silagei]|uniref:hypothetical protein n=1 Tax=Secundilactobacillus silagei TaxID=1293415 RepID=UPI000A8A7C7A|nr:hypothetical protein [Secundilactobacillus silagei]
MAANADNALELERLFTDLTQAITQNRTLDEFGLTRLQAMTLKKRLLTNWHQHESAR